jgi:predicted metal-dependent phosphoesterase TrpH
MNQASEKFLRVELHCHTIVSHDSLMTPKKLLARCNQIGIDKVAITDHNAINAALACAGVHPERVIVGEEIQTNEGEILGYYMSEWVPPDLSPMETIHLLREQGAVISIPHPFDLYRGSHWKAGTLAAIAPFVDAIETFNARCLSQEPNQQAVAFAEAQNLLATVGSDAHCRWELGRATLRLPNFNDANSFKAALVSAQPVTKLSPPYIHLTSRIAVFWKGISNKGTYDGTCK